ncbi:MAG: triose-phosphate isomerase [Acidobacteriota bacterium]
MPRPLVAANWKMYKTPEEAAAYLRRWASMPFPPDREVLFLPPFPLLAQVRDALPGGQSLGAQNLHEMDEGAFTGEVSPRLLSAMGCRYALVGHSERRNVFGETDGRLGAKFRAALSHGLRPVFCVGERLEEREGGRTLEVVLGQLAAGLGGSPPDSGFDLAYEPVWAIGTGKVARPEDAAEVHASIRAWLSARGGSSDVRILYGGSVKPDNAADLLGTPEVGGLLVGGASLDPGSFHGILTAAP